MGGGEVEAVAPGASAAEREAELRQEVAEIQEEVDEIELLLAELDRPEADASGGAAVAVPQQSELPEASIPLAQSASRELFTGELACRYAEAHMWRSVVVRAQ